MCPPLGHGHLVVSRLGHRERSCSEDLGSRVGVPGVGYVAHYLGMDLLGHWVFLGLHFWGTIILHQFFVRQLSSWSRTATKRALASPWGPNTVPLTVAFGALCDGTWTISPSPFSTSSESRCLSVRLSTLLLPQGHEVPLTLCAAYLLPFAGLSSDVPQSSVLSPLDPPVPGPTFLPASGSKRVPSEHAPAQLWWTCWRPVSPLGPPLLPEPWCQQGPLRARLG